MRNIIKKLRVALSLGCVALATLVQAQEDPKQAPAAECIQKLIQDLGADDFPTREKATEELKKIGPPAVSALREAAQDTDEERAGRARKILKEFERQEKNAKENREADLGGRHQLRQQFKFHIQRQDSDEGEQYQMSLERFSDGSIRLTERTKKDGKEEEKRYEADSGKEFKEKYPEIAKRYGISEGKNAYRFGGGAGEDDFADVQKQMEEHLRRMEEGDKNLRERFFQFDEEWDKLWKDLHRFGDRGKGEEKSPRKRKNEAESFGVRVHSADETLRKQLNLGEGEGIVVKEVTAGSFAEQMGLQKHDVILALNGKEVKNVWEFRVQVKEALNQKELALEILRGGKKETLKAKNKLLREFQDE